jgi:signal transduction histidine kinase
MIASLSTVKLEDENLALRKELEHAQLELHRVNRMKRDFCALAAHELRSPLAILFGYAKILETETQGPTRERAEVVSMHAWRLKNIVDAMVILQQLDAGEFTLHFGQVKVAPAIRNVVDSQQRDIAEKGLVIETHVEPEASVYVDRERFELVLVGLLANAIKYSPRGASIAIGAQVSSDHAMISVKDGGIGIPPEEQAHVFERFYQASDPLTRRYSGLGLGLSIAKAIVELHGGRIWLDSSVGKGSAFYISLPRGPSSLRVPLPSGQAPVLAD